MITLKESILTNTKSKIKNVKDVLDTLGRKYRFASMKIYDRMGDYVDRIHYKNLDKVVKGKTVISKQVQDALDDTYKWNYSYGHPDKQVYYNIIEKLFIWLDNVIIQNATNPYELEQALNEEIREQHIGTDDCIFVHMNYCKRNTGFYKLYFGANLCVADFAIDMRTSNF